MLSCIIYSITLPVILHFILGYKLNHGDMTPTKVNTAGIKTFIKIILYATYVNDKKEKEFIEYERYQLVNLQDNVNFNRTWFISKTTNKLYFYYQTDNGIKYSEVSTHRSSFFFINEGESPHIIKYKLRVKPEELKRPFITDIDYNIYRYDVYVPKGTIRLQKLNDPFYI